MVPGGPWRVPGWQGSHKVAGLTRCQGSCQCSWCLVQVPVLLSGLGTVLLSAPVAPWLLSQALPIMSPAKLEVLPSIPARSPPPHLVGITAGLQQPGWDDL